MTESDLFGVKRQFRLAPAPSVEKLPFPKLPPNGRFAWPFPVARLQDGEGKAKGGCHGSRNNADGFVT